MPYAGALQANETEAPWALDYSHKLGRLTKEQAMDLVNSKRGSADRGHDPLHLTMRKTWFIAITHFMNLRNQTYEDMLADIDTNFMPHDSAYSANLILPYVMRQIARLASVNPPKTVIPMSTDHDDSFAAEVGESILNYVDVRDDWDLMRMHLCWWLVLCGHGFIKSEWDPAIGKMMRELTNPFDGSPIEDGALDESQMESLRKMGGVKEHRSGDLAESVLAPFQVTLPRGVTSLKRSPWLIYEEDVSPADVWDRWPSKARHLVPDDYSASSENIYWKRVRHMANRFGNSLPTAGADADETISLIHFWMPPSGYAPDGLKVTMTKSVLLEKGPHPFYKAGLDPRDPDWEHMRYPLSDARYIPVIGRYWGMGLVEHLIGPQQQANMSTDQLLRQRDRLGSAVWLSQRDNDLKHEGDIWTYKANTPPPIAVAPPQIGQAQVTSDEMVQNHMRFIASQSPMTLGETSSGIRSGDMLEQAHESDNEPLGATFTELKSCYTQNSRRVLTLFWKFQEQERMIQIRGEGRGMDAQVFKGADLNGNVFVEIDNSDMRPKSRAAMIQLAMTLMQGGMLDPLNPKDKAATMDAVQFRQLDHLFHGPRLQLRRARIEQIKFQRPDVDAQSGTQRPHPDVNDYDDHEIHVEEHRTFMATDQFERLPLLTRFAFEQHVRKHEQAIADMLMAQQAMMASTQPAGLGGEGGEEKGQPSPPKQQQPSPAGQGILAG